MPPFIRFLHSVKLFTAVVAFTCMSATADDLLHLGMALPLTGAVAEYAEAYRHGVELGLSDHPTAKQRLRIVFEDHQYDAKQSLSAVRKLNMDPDIRLIFVWGFTPSDAVAPIAPGIQKPLLLASINPVSKDRPNILNVESSLETLVTPLKEYLQHRSYKPIAIIAAQLGALVQCSEILKAALPPETILSSDIVSADVVDFRSIIARLKGKNIEGVALLVGPDQARIFVQQSRELGFEPDYFGGNTLNAEPFLRLFGQTEQTPVFFDSYLDPAFRSRYLETFKRDSHITEAARGYLLVTLLQHVLRVAKSFTAADLMQTLKTLPAGTGPAGHYRITEDADFGLHVALQPALYRIKHGNVELFQKESNASGNTKK
jgi:ABC-type branched-subunit amino acid transport system substrate-binding protein